MSRPARHAALRHAAPDSRYAGPGPMRAPPSPDARTRAACPAPARWEAGRGAGGALGDCEGEHVGEVVDVEAQTVRRRLRPQHCPSARPLLQSPRPPFIYASCPPLLYASFPLRPSAHHLRASSRLRLHELVAAATTLCRSGGPRCAVRLTPRSLQCSAAPLRRPLTPRSLRPTRRPSSHAGLS